MLTEYWTAVRQRFPSGNCPCDARYRQQLKFFFPMFNAIEVLTGLHVEDVWVRFDFLKLNGPGDDETATPTLRFLSLSGCSD